MILSKPDEETTMETAGWEWMLVEVMGFRKHWGRTREEERIGGKFLRVDIPNKGDPAVHGWTTHFYGAPAIFSITLTDEVTVMKENMPWDSPARLRLRYEPMEVIEPEPSPPIPPIVILNDDDAPDPSVIHDDEMPF
jgi:hypothetical protein